MFEVAPREVQASLCEGANIDVAGFDLVVDERFYGFRCQRFGLCEHRVPWWELDGADAVHADPDATSGGVGREERAGVEIEVEGVGH
jgi:hypothetical protein